MSLQGTRVLLVEDDDDAREILGMSLTSKGAIVREAASGEAALALVASWPPDVVLMDLSLPGMDGLSAFTRIRAQPDCHQCVGIALSGHGREADRARSVDAGFAKHLVKPAAIGDIVSAITVSKKPADDATFDVRALLEQLNRTGTCQFTSVLRFTDRDTLVSTWTYDRNAPNVDSFPVGLAIEASYCLLVRQTRTTLMIGDAPRDERVADHPKRLELSAYLGVPIFRSNGTLYGTLCSFDVDPQVFTDEARRSHESAATTLSAHLGA